MSTMAPVSTTVSPSSSSAEIDQLEDVLAGREVQHRNSTDEKLRMPHRPQLALQIAKRASWEAKSRERTRRDERTVALRGTKAKANDSGASRNINPLRAYLKGMSKLKLLTADEEVILGRHIQKGVMYEKVRAHLESVHSNTISDQDWAAAVGLSEAEMMKQLARSHRAKMSMINSNLRLVVSIAKRYRFRGLALSDLIQEGTFGLVKASEKFDPERGFKFSTYATWWIKQAVMRGLADQDRVIRLPAHVHNFLSLVRKATREMTNSRGEGPTDAELSARLECSQEKLRYYLKAAREAISIDKKVGGKLSRGDGETDELGELVSDGGGSPEELAQTTSMHGGILQLLSTLSTREQMVVRARFGLDGLQPKTLEDIGRAFRLTRERVRQIEMGALHKLRQPYRNYRVQDFTPTGQLLGEAGPGKRETPPRPSDVVAAAAAIAEAEAEGRQSELNAVRARMNLQPVKEVAVEPVAALGVFDDGDNTNVGHVREQLDERGALPERAGARQPMSDMDMELAQKALEEQWALELDEETGRAISSTGDASRLGVLEERVSLEFLDLALAPGPSGGKRYKGASQSDATSFKELNQPWAVAPDVAGKGSKRWANMSHADQCAMEKAAEAWCMAKESEQLLTQMTPEEWARELAAV